MRPTKETEILTVADVGEPSGDDPMEARFNERQQIFEFPRSKAALAGRLREALDAGAPVKAVLNPRRSTLVRVDAPSERELREFERERILLDEPERPFKLDLERIDPTTFNIVDHYLKVPTFRLCTKVMPNYKVAKDIFDFCAAQSCHLPGPYAISHCIPFQYVRDGCYARAHKMRQIITDQYGYCCEKVFSFAIPYPHRLALKAGKWGGCCVTWWYHVAPARAGADQDQAPLVQLRLRACDGDRPGHVRQAGAAELLARGAGGHELLGERENDDVLDPARLGLHAGKRLGDGIFHRPELHRHAPDADQLQESNDVPVSGPWCIEN
jgi:Glutaminase